LWDALRGAGRRRELHELLDRPDVDPGVLAGNLGDLRLMNRWLGWAAAVRRDLDVLMARRALRSATVLDIATGSADIPRHIVVAASRRQRRVTAIASDVSAAVLAQARAADPAARVALVQHDGAALPFRDAAVDFVLCNLAAHHFAPETLARVLAEMWRVARCGVLVSDLTRGRWSYLGARLVALLLHNPLTAHDGPVSVLRAYTPEELRSLARGAGLERVRVRRRFPARMTLTAEKGTGP
jgi:ubiquinone/menaquinone biosynthesis C-methylase UbiE